MKLHPDDPWPPMRGHVVLAWPGTLMEEKGYHEPGAWFSPAPGSFGVTVLPQRASRQQLLNWGISTSNDAWQASWVARGPCNYELRVEPHVAGVKVRVQSAGPAGGPITSLERTKIGLIINRRWVLQRLRDSTSGGEGDWRWVEIPIPSPRVLPLRSVAPCAAPPFELGGGVHVETPDRRFNGSLQAQEAHLLMGLTGDETRPGETVNYPLKWLRDGTYSLTALARTGHLPAARTLARQFAEQDFFGGFGSEADAPGLALWALEEVAARLRDPKFDAWLWPHAKRKAAWIVRMRHTTEPIRIPPSGPIVPRHRRDPNLDFVCDTARDGLIIGRMDHHRPLLFVNAVSYAGLMHAAALADRTGMKADSMAWRTEAAELREAWWRAFDLPKERGNERTAIVGLWPTGVAADQPARYRAALPDPDFTKRPLWTYFDLARANNWLLLGEPDKAWRTLEYFWANQPSPGLYTLWEGEGEENTFGLWENIRGWTAPPYVTPHYWAAAEMLHLQLDMLVYEDGHDIVIGAGVKPEWLAKDITIRGIHTRRGVVNWTWAQRKLIVTLDGKPVPYRPGSAFAAAGVKPPASN